MVDVYWLEMFCISVGLNWYQHQTQTSTSTCPLDEGAAATPGTKDVANISPILVEITFVAGGGIYPPPPLATPGYPVYP